MNEQMMNDDMALVREFAARQSEPAFAALVERHLGLVHSAAVRQVGDPHLAEEITQAVFVLLARKARSLGPDTILSAWLYRATRYAAADMLKIQRRRQRREQEAYMQSTVNEPDVWAQVAPLLDDAMAELRDRDRTALVLRFFENKPAREIAGALKLTEDAAQKRVTRALEKLRGIFAKRGVTLTGAAIAGAVSANAMQAVPVGLAAKIFPAAVLAGTTVATTTAIVMTTLQKAVVGAALAAAVGTGIYQARQASNARAEVEALKQQQRPLADQIRQWARERDEAASRIAGLREEVERLNRNTVELLRLRAEVARLRSDSQARADPQKTRADAAMQAEMKAWLSRVDQLKQRFEQTPGAKIPELRFLTEQDWLGVARSNLLKTDEDYRKAMAEARLQAATQFGMVVQGPLREFAGANNGQFPANLSQLEPYFKQPADGTVLQRYQIIPGIYLGDAAGGFGGWVITQKALVDEQEDSHVAIAADGFLLRGVRAETDGAWDAAISAFATANNGHLPKSIHELKPYLSTPSELAAFKKRTDFDRGQTPKVIKVFPH